MNVPSDLINKIKELKKPTVIEVSGFGGSGKSSFAKALGEVLNAPVIGVDSFQLKGAFNTSYKLWEIMDYSRLENEVLIPFTNNEPVIKYGNFDASLEQTIETKEIVNNGIIIIEGVGLFRPELLKYFSLKIWVDCPIETAIERGKKRDRYEYGSPTDELWDNLWKENDLEYFEKFSPKEKSDYIYNNG